MYYLFNHDKWRYERKFVIAEITKHEIESIVKLHPAIFSEIFYERQINNIYFDTFHMDNYIDNEVGTSKRLKIRIRWYGKLFGYIKKPVLEIKIKTGYLGSKISYPMAPFTLSDNLNLDSIQFVFKNSQLIPDIIKEELLKLKLSLLNCYRRKYFRSADNNFRITVDSDMVFFHISENFNTFLHKSTDYINTVLELKYDKLFDDYAEKITNEFSFRLTKSSKYVSGVNHLQL